MSEFPARYMSAATLAEENNQLRERLQYVSPERILRMARQLEKDGQISLENLALILGVRL